MPPKLGNSWILDKVKVWVLRAFFLIRRNYWNRKKWSSLQTTMNFWKSDFYNLIGGYDSSHFSHAYISKWWWDSNRVVRQTLPLILRTSCGIYFTLSTHLSSVECALPKLKSSSQPQFHRCKFFFFKAPSRLQTKPLRLSLVQIGELGPKLCVCRAVWTTQRVG